MRAALLLLACAARADARYADQLGEFDWHVSNIGGVKRAVFQGRQAFVVTDVTGADRALVAALNARTGEVDWRHLLPEGEQGDEIAVFADAVVTLSGGSMVRAWRSSDGAAMWDIKAPGLARPDGKLFVTSHEGKCAVVALAGEAVLALDCETGSSLAGWPWFAEVGDDPKLAAALRPFSTGDLRLVDAASTGDGSIVVAGVSACGAVAVAATLRPFSSAESSTASAWPASGASHFNVLARADGTVSICYLQDAHVFVRDVETAATSFVAATGLLGEAAASLTAEPNSAFRVLRLRGALLQRFIVADGSTVAPVGPACADCALGAFATPLEAGQAARVFVAESFAVPGGTRTVSRAASPHSEALFSEEVAPLHSEQHGSPARVFLHLFEKRDKSEGDVGYRAMLTTSCDSVAMVGPNKVSWVREEALAFVTQAVFVAPKTLAVGPQAHTVLDRYKAQLRHLVDSARHTSLWTSAESKNEVREQTRQLNAKRYGLDKVAVLLNAQAGKVFAVGLDTGAVLWSRIVPVGCTLLAASATHVALFQPPLKTLFLDAISGAATEGAAPDVDHVIPTPLSCEGQKVYVAFTASEILAGNGTASVVPLQAYAAVSDMLTAHPLHFHLLRAGTLRCFCVDASFKAHSLGSVNIAIGHEKLVAHAYADKDEPNNKNKAQVLGDDALLLKYQNPHLAVFITADAGGSDSPFADYKAQNDDGTAPQTLRVTLVDTVSARVVYRLVVPHGAAPAHAVVLDNFVVYAYWNSKAQRQELGSISLHEGMIERHGLSPLKVPEQEAAFSSWSAPLPVALQRSFALGKPIVSLSATVTARAVASKHVLVGIAPGQVAALDRRLLDPRRPSLDDASDRAQRQAVQRELDEGLQPYQPYLPLQPRAFASSTRTILGLRTIWSTPSKLESTSLIFAVGIDMFGCRHTPSGTFDLLADDFQYGLLLLLLGAFAVAAAALRHGANRKALALNWA